MDTKRRSYDIFDIEERVHALELGGGSTPTPTPTSDNYSTTEAEIGNWLDDKLYRKVIPLELSEIEGSKQAEVCDVSSLGIDKLIRADFVIGATAWNAPYTPTKVWLANNKINILTLTNESFSSITSSYLILEYTKVASPSKTKRSTKK